MARGRTKNMDDFINDYEATAEDYAKMGALWAEMYFPDDFETLSIILSARGQSAQTEPGQQEASERTYGYKK